MARYHAALVEQSSRTPTYFVRYEDLRLNPLPVLKEMFAFMLEVDSIDGTVLEKRLIEVCSTEHTTKARYKLKSTSSNLSRNQGLYTKEQLEYMGKVMQKHNYFFGYANVRSES